MNVRVCAALILALTCSVAQAVTCTSVAGANNWGVAATWTCTAGGAHIPANGEDVVIANGSTVTLNVSSNTLASLAVNGNLVLGGNNTNRTLTVTGNVTVGGTMIVNNTGGTPTHTVTVGGNLTNTGTIDMRIGTALGNFVFNGAANRTVSGAGSFDFNNVTINMGGAAVVLDMQPTFTAPNGFLTITQGIYEHSSPSSITPFTAATTIGANDGFWLNNASAIVTTGNFNVTVTGGLLQIDAGTWNLGTVNTNQLILSSNATTRFTMNGGAFNTPGGIVSSVVGASGLFTIAGGTVTLRTIPAGANEALMLGSATTFTMSGGTIVFQNAPAAGTNSLNLRGTQNVTGGTIQLGSAARTGITPFLITNTTGGTLNVWNLIVFTTGSPSASIGAPVNILNDLTIQTGTTFNDNNAGTPFAINIGGGNTSGKWINNGTFTATTGTVTFTGTSTTQTIGGTATTTFNNLTINKASSDVTIPCGTPSPVINGTLALTLGDIITSGTSPACLTACANQVPVIVGAAGTITGGSATSYVAGALRKNFNANSTLNFRATAGQDEFPVGTTTVYAPIEITTGGTGAAGNLIVCVINGDNTNMTEANGGGINLGDSVNRYWSITNTGLNTDPGSGLPGALRLDMTFKYLSADRDNTGSPGSSGSFIVERWNGSSWNPTTVVTPTTTSTRVQNVVLTAGTNEFQIGVPITTFPPVLGSFNAFDIGGPVGAVIGVIQTKQVGTPFSLRVVRILNNAVDTTYNTAGVVVELRDGSDVTGGFVTGCRSTWGPPATLIGSVTVNFAAGVATAAFPAAQIPNVYRNVRVRILAGAGCSSDRFAIRPTTISIDAADTNWQSAGTTRTLTNASATGGFVHAASEPPAASNPRPFTLRATPQAAGGQSASRYDGVPTLVSGFPVCCTPSTTPACSTLPATCTLGALAFTSTPAAWAGTGTRTNATAYYSEAGVINLQFEDTGFASEDANDGSLAATRTVPATATASIGRFVPDNFTASSLVTPIFLTFNTNDASCSAPPSGPKRSFTYVGQGFGFSTGPSVRITARNAAGTPTTNYKGSLWKVGAGGGTSSVAKDCTTNPDVCLFTTTWSAPAAGSVAESYSYTLVPVSTPNWDNAIATGTAPSLTINGNGTGDFAFAAGVPGDRLAFKRNATTPLSTFTASIDNAITVTDDTEAGTSGNGTLSASLTFPSGFDQGNGFRYGVVRLQDVFAPLLGNSSFYAPVSMLTQYWNGTTFVTNTEDNCTSFTEKNFVLYSPAGSITAANLPTPTAGSNGKVSMGVAIFASGIGRVNVIGTGAPPAPITTITQPGSVKICLDLDASPGSQIDNACVAVTPANKAYLQGRWVGTSYNKDPNATVGFGLYGSQPKNFIYFRENY